MKTQKNPENETFQGVTSDYRIIETEDQTLTLWSEHFDESCHSLDGALLETKFVYLDGCKIQEKIKNQEVVNILEVGLGSGVGLKATLDLFETLDSDTKLNYFALEIDPGLINWLKKRVEITTDRYPNPNDLIEIQNSIFSTTKNGSSITVILGDARKSLPQAISEKIIPKIDAIYQDPFSPAKNPTLWTKEWFQLLKDISSKDVILTTYSSATKIKKSMLEAGWLVFETPGFSTKRSSTMATLHGKMDQKLLDRLKNSNAVALTDKLLYTD